MEGDLDSIDYFGETPETASDMKITNTQDLPGWDATFDDVNLHLHGMQVVPHLFYPQVSVRTKLRRAIVFVYTKK